MSKRIVRYHQCDMYCTYVHPYMTFNSFPTDRPILNDDTLYFPNPLPPTIDSVSSSLRTTGHRRFLPDSIKCRISLDHLLSHVLWTCTQVHCFQCSVFYFFVIHSLICLLCPYPLCSNPVSSVMLQASLNVVFSNHSYLVSNISPPYYTMLSTVA